MFSLVEFFNYSGFYLSESIECVFMFEVKLVDHLSVSSFTVSLFSLLLQRLFPKVGGGDG